MKSLLEISLFTPKKLG